MNKPVILLLAGTILLPLGCKMTPKYARPEAPVPVEWPSGSAYAANLAGTNGPGGSQPPWQEFITDDKLRRVISLALANNRDLRLAALNVERARAIYGIQRAQLYPTVDASASGVKSRVPADLASGGQRHTAERYDVNLGVVSWELDFFGRIRSFKDRAMEEYLGTEQARNSVQIMLVSSVAYAYLALAADRENLKLAETTLAAQQDTLNLIKRRHQIGIAPELDVHRAETQVESARVDLAAFTRQVAQGENALHLLLGAAVPETLLPAALDQVNPPAAITPGLPSEVLLRRPDVLQAEHSLRAANADIGAARAAFFPRITLTSAFGTASGELSGLFKAGSSAWTYAPQIVMPIFDARTWSAHKTAKLQREIAVVQYEKAIQTSFKEVADALAARGTVGQQAAAQESLVKSLEATHRLSKLRYGKGIDSYLGVLDAQRSLYTAQQGLVILRLADLASQVRLYSVLGGGWEMPLAAEKVAAR